MKKLWTRLLLTTSASALLLCASGCTTAPVMTGRVVEVPQVVLPPPPKLVQETQTRPVGYYRKLLLDALQTP